MRMASCALPCIRPLETSASLDSHDVKATKSLDDRLTHLPISLPGTGYLVIIMRYVTITMASVHKCLSSQSSEASFQYSAFFSLHSASF